MTSITTAQGTFGVQFFGSNPHNVEIQDFLPPSPLLLAVAEGTRMGEPGVNAAFWGTLGVMGGNAVAAAGAAIGSGGLTTLGLHTAGRVALTAHAAQRAAERGISQAQIDLAVQTAGQAGRVVEQIGKYGTPQLVYRGLNGITVVVETAGRNAGKAITVFWSAVK